MNDAWTKLLWRLQAVTNNCQVPKKEQSFNGKKYEHGGEGAAFIEIELFLVNGFLVCWSRPDRIPLEPKQFDLQALSLKMVKGWDDVLIDLKRETGSRIKKTLVVRDGRPVGWYREEVVEKMRVVV